MGIERALSGHPDIGSSAARSAVDADVEGHHQGMSTSRDEREARQLALMRERVEQFRAEEIGIGRAIADLKGLLSALEQAPGDWRDAFTMQWGVLEVGYAVALDGQLPVPRASDPDIAAALNKLEQLIATRSGKDV